MSAPVAPPRSVTPPPSGPVGPAGPVGPNAPHDPSDPSARPDHGPLVQRLLLGAGALCVLVAGAVYLAVSWHRIGTGGQAGIALVVTALAAIAAHLFVRRSLRASAETFAAVAAGLLALDLAGAHHLDVFGAARLEWWAWLTIATAAVLVATGALTLVDGLRAYRAVAVGALVVLPWTSMLAVAATGVDVSAGVGAVVGLVVAAGLTVLAAVIGARDLVSAATASVGAGAWWLVAVAAGCTAARSSRTLVELLPATLAWGALTVALLVVTGRVVAAGRTADDRRILVSVLAPIAAAPGVLVLALAATELGVAAELVTAALVAALWAVPWTSRRGGRPLGAGALVLGTLLPLVALVQGDGTDVAAALVFLLAGATAGAVAHGRGIRQTLAAVAELATVVLGVGLVAIERSQPGVWLAVGWTAVAFVLLAVASVVAAQRELALAGAGVIGGLALLTGLVGQAFDHRSPALAVTLLGLGAGALLFGAARASRVGVLLGSTAVALAAIDLAAVAGVDAVEAYTLPLAGVALVAGVLARIGRPELSSWAWAAPAVLVAAVPSVVATLADPGVTRLVVTAAAAAVLTVLGLRSRLAALLLLGAATEAALAISQLAPYAVGTPRWVTLALAGALLLTLGVLFERARRGAAHAGRWFATLN